MKFAYVSLTYGTMGDAAFMNIGESIQSYGVRVLLEKMGAENENIEEFLYKDGEILLASGEKIPEEGDEIIFISANQMNLHQLPSRVKCIPIAYNTFGRNISAPEIAYLKKNEPIGARDEMMCTLLSKAGIDTYLNGCISIILPKIQRALDGAVYIVDAPIEILDKIPSDIRRGAIIRTQEYYFDAHTRPNPNELKALARERYQEYQQNARLVITSRLHVASPCLAWGIPVILIRKNPFRTFSWIDKYIPVHNFNTLDTIDWNGYTVDIEDAKRMILDNTIALITKKIYGEKPWMAIDRFYQNRPYRSDYYETIIEGAWKKIQEIFDSENGELNYILWGITFNAEILYTLIQEKYPKARLVYAIDTYKRVNFHGLNTCRPHEAKFENNFVIVIPTGAVQAAYNYLQNEPYKYVCFVTEKFIQQEDL